MLSHKLLSNCCETNAALELHFNLVEIRVSFLTTRQQASNFKSPGDLIVFIVNAHIIYDNRQK